MINHFRYINVLILLFINPFLYAQNNSISGFITDQETGEALIGANVFIQETGNGMSTDKNGYYVIQNIISGNYNLIVSYIGYNTFKKEINLSQNEFKKLKVPERFSRDISVGPHNKVRTLEGEVMITSKLLSC